MSPRFASLLSFTLLAVATAAPISRRGNNGQVMWSDMKTASTNACGIDVSNIQHVAGVGASAWKEGAACNSVIDITDSNGKSVSATVVEHCSGCSGNDILVDHDTFESFGHDAGRGVFPATWELNGQSSGDKQPDASQSDCYGSADSTADAPTNAAHQPANPAQGQDHDGSDWNDKSDAHDDKPDVHDGQTEAKDDLPGAQAVHPDAQGKPDTPDDQPDTPDDQADPQDAQSDMHDDQKDRQGGEDDSDDQKAWSSGSNNSTISANDTSSSSNSTESTCSAKPQHPQQLQTPVDTVQPNNNGTVDADSQQSQTSVEPVQSNNNGTVNADSQQSQTSVEPVQPNNNGTANAGGDVTWSNFTGGPTACGITVPEGSAEQLVALPLSAFDQGGAGSNCNKVIEITASSGKPTQARVVDSISGDSALIVTPSVFKALDKDITLGSFQLGSWRYI